MEKDKLAHLHLILDSTRKIKQYISGMDFSAFLLDEKTQSAVIMQLHVVGELSKNMPEEIKLEIDLPWKKISGMRDIVAHDYFKLDLESVWKTATEDILEAESKIRSYLDDR